MIPVWLSMIITISALWIGFSLGKGHARSRTPKVKDTSKCSCKHVYSMHDKSGECLAECFYIDGVKVSSSFACRCVNYDGVPPAHIFMRDV